MSDGKLIPFGKYKGQLIEVISEDKEYLDWLTAQGWFREKYASLYQIVINNFCEPSETPEHNALQARFLDPAFRLKFAAAAIRDFWYYTQPGGDMIKKAAAWIAEWHNNAVAENAPKRDTALAANATEKKSRGLLSKWHEEHYSPEAVAERAAEIEEGYKKATFVSWKFTPPFSTEPLFENRGRDVEFFVESGLSIHVAKDSHHGQSYFSENLNIEVKPEISDDYPAILRQMRRNRATLLFTRGYFGTGVDKQTFIKFMESQKISVIFEHEVDSADEIEVEMLDEKKFLEMIREEKIRIASRK